ncbi:MAG: 6-carboxytetrahydropterin synthase [Thermoanaerobaculia bacterium]
MGNEEIRIAAGGASDYDATVGRYRVEVHAAFEAAHHLRAYRGATEAVHGHSWRVSIEIVATELDSEGMAFDFIAARAVLLEMVAQLDHRDINSVPPFDVVSPTTEVLARWFYDGLCAQLPDARVRSATVWEGPNCSATYIGDEEAGFA